MSGQIIHAEHMFNKDRIALAGEYILTGDLMNIISDHLSRLLDTYEIDRIQLFEAVYMAAIISASCDFKMSQSEFHRIMNDLIDNDSKYWDEERNK